MQSQIRYNLLLKALNHGLVFLINILLVRSLGASLSGVYFNDLYWLSALAFLGSLGLDYTVIAVIASNTNQFSFWCKKIWQWTFLFLPLMCGLIFFLFHFSIISSQTIIIASIFTFGQLLSILFQGLLGSIKAFKAQNKILIITNLIFLAFLGITHLTSFQIQPSLIFKAMAFTVFAQGMLLGIVSWQIKKTTAHPTNSDFWESIKHGVVVMISTVIYFFFIRVDGFFVEHISTPNQLSMYVQCGKIGQYFLLFASLVSSSFIPFISEEKESQNNKDWQKILFPYALLMVIMAFLIFILGKWIFPWLFGPAFETMYKLMNILLPGYLALGFLTLLNAFYIGRKKINRMLIGDAIGLAIILAINLLLLKYKNIEWIATTSTCCFFLLFLFMGVGIKKRLGFKK